MRKLLFTIICLFLAVSFLASPIKAEEVSENIITIDQVSNDIKINSNDDAFLTSLCDNGTVKIVKSFLNNNSVDAVNFVVKEFKNEQDLTVIEKNDGYALIHVADNTLYTGNYYVMIEGVQELYALNYNGLPLSPVSDVQITEDENGVLTVTANEDYIYGVYGIKLQQENNGTTYISGESIIKAQDHASLSFELGDCNIGNGPVSISVFNYKYEDYKYEELVLAHSPIKECPAFEFSLNEVGDLLISCDDHDFLAALCMGRNIGNVIEGNANTISFSDGFNLNPVFEVLNDSCVIWDCEDQREVLNGLCINGLEYSVSLSAKGYTVSSPFALTFTNAKSYLPKDTTFRLGNKVGYIFSKDESFISYLKDSNYSVSYTTNDNGAFLVLTLGETGSSFEAEDTYTLKCDLSSLSDDVNLKDVKLSLNCDMYVPNDAINNSKIQITAKQDAYKVTFDANGGSGEMNYVLKGGDYKLPASGFVAPSNKDFVGWFVGSDNTVRFVGETCKIKNDTVIKAVWKEKATAKTTIKSDSIVANKVVNLTSNKDTKLSFSGDLEKMVSSNEKELGVALWMEVATKGKTSSDFNQMQRGYNLENEGSVLECMEINIFKKVKDQDTVRLSEIDVDAEISFDLTGNENLIKLAEEGRLSVYNIHNGELIELGAGSYNKDTHIFTFKTKQFSLFGFVDKQTSAELTSGNAFVIPSTGIK